MAKKDILDKILNVLNIANGLADEMKADIKEIQTHVNSIMNHNIPDLTSKYEILLADVDRYLKVVREIEKKTNEFEKKINTTMEIGEHLELQKQISDIYSRINAELPNLSNKNNPPQN